MGHSITPTYRLEYWDGSTHSQAWQGRATVKRLESWVFDYSASLRAGGVNQHISRSLGYIPYPTIAVIVRQSDGERVAEWSAGKFQVY